MGFPNVFLFLFQPFFPLKSNPCSLHTPAFSITACCSWSTCETENDFLTLHSLTFFWFEVTFRVQSPIFVNNLITDTKKVRNWKPRSQRRPASSQHNKPITLATNISRCAALWSFWKFQSPELRFPSGMAMSFEPAGYHHGYHETAPRSLHPMTRRQDSQQHKMNKLQSSSGLGEFPYAAAFRREPARALGRRYPEASCASRG